MKRTKKRKLTGVLAALCFTVALALLLSSAGATLAKYIRQDKGNGAAVAAPFYFTSDKLAEDVPYFRLSEPVEGEAVEVEFSLSNFVDELRCTESTMQYSYWAQDANSAVISGASGSGQLSGSFQTETVTLTLNRSNFGDGGAVTVFAQCTAPYEKTISAQFGFAARAGKLQWTVEEEEGTVVMKLAGGSGGVVTVSWPSSLEPSPFNELLSDSSGESAAFTAQPGVRYALAFLKENPQETYTAEDFSVTEG